MIILKGGAWISIDRLARSAFIYMRKSKDRRNTYGFRLKLRRL